MFKPVVRGKAPNDGNREEEIKRNDDGRNNMNEPGSPKTMKEPVSHITSPGWSVNKNIIESIRKSANKYYMLTDLTEEGGNLGNQDPSVLEEVDLEEVDLEEVDVYEEVTGLHYTWTKSLMNHNASVLKKIDRVMGSGDFMEVYSRAHAVFLPYGISDHSPVILTCSNDVRKNTKSFQFANYIADKMEFGNLVMIDEDPHNRPLKVMGVDALKEYSVALDDEEKLLFQRAKVNWLNDGDMNSDFFHKVIKGRINRSIVGEIWSEDNVRYSGDQIPSQFVNHFKNFLGVQSSKECLELYNDLFSNKISEQEAISMIEEVTNEEVKAAMFNIDDNKAPGPDGFTAKFYKKDWHVVGNDVCEAVKEFFTKGKDCEKVVTGKKYVKVEYDWKLALCSFCKVFGNNDKKCSTRPKTYEELEELKKNEAQKSEGNDEFVPV
nr:hypothetical protein [Tanacetum cinerariifolium]